MLAFLHSPALRSAALTLIAAAVFCASTPLVQFFGVGLGALISAALLYAGAAGEDPAIPEPATLTLMGVGAIGLLGYGWRRRRGPAVP